MNRIRRDRQSGYVLIEAMITLALFGAFALVSTHLLITSITVSISAKQSQETALRFDLAMSQLRADVWSARSIESDGTFATLRQPGGRSVIWRTEPATSNGLRRGPFVPEVNLIRLIDGDRSSAGPASQPADRAMQPTELTQWSNLPAMAFDASGPCLRIRAPMAGDASSPGELTMVSQRGLAEAQR